MSRTASAARRERPDPSEYASYYENYVRRVPDGDIVESLERQRREMGRLFESIDEERAAYRYAEGKWSIRQLVGHLIDSERVFSYRALTFARGGTAELPGFDENEFVRNAPFDAIAFRQLAGEFDLLRRATLLLFEPLPEEAWSRSGTANARRVTVRALAWTTAGHVEHHLAILRERYLE